MTDCVKEEEFRYDEGFDQHNRARCNDGQETDDVHHANGIKDYVAWTRQGLLKERHRDDEVR